ncbi:MAG: hypothetical protein ACHQLA_00070 [Ignavibacteriales bacterium]
MFSGAISVRILSEDHILAVRSKARWFAEKIGFNIAAANVLSVIISETARLIFSKTKYGRMDIFSVNNQTKRGIAVMAIIEEMERDNAEIRGYAKQEIIRRTDLGKLVSKKIIDEYKTFPGANNDTLMQFIKWV